MIDKTDLFFQRLTDRLGQTLPGRLAHEEMMPTMANGYRYTNRPKGDKKPRQGAVLILLFVEEGEVKMPLIQRTSYPGVHSGQIALPGGGEEEIDVALEQTALREAREEIGIDSERVTLLGNLSSFYVAVSNYQVLPVVAKYKGIPSFLPEPREVEKVIITSLNEVTATRNQRRKEIETTAGVKLDAPYYAIDEHVVWGATAMMLSELVMILKELNNQ